jgi:cysteine desulfurase / selenocysteine lyase
LPTETKTETNYRREFADFEGAAYLNTASQGAIPLRSAQASQEALAWKTRPYELPDDIYFDFPDRIRAKAARIIGAAPEEIAVTSGASTGLAAVAAGVDWKPGDEVLLGRGEFPAHFSTWLRYHQAGKIKMRVVAPRGQFISADDYIENIGPRTRIVSASLVRFDNGARLDAARVAEACRKAGAGFVLDVTQCAGAMPLSIRELGADMAVCSGYKWLLGPYGTGFFWVSGEWTERLALGAAYFLSLEGARQLHSMPGENARVSPGARRWDSAETANFTNLAALDSSLDLVLEIGLDAIDRHNYSLISQLIERLPAGFQLASPSERERRGPYACIAARTPEKTTALYEKLGKERIFVALREGALRIAPHLYNTSEDVDRLIEVLAAA